MNAKRLGWTLAVPAFLFAGTAFRGVANADDASSSAASTSQPAEMDLLGPPPPPSDEWQHPRRAPRAGAQHRPMDRDDATLAPPEPFPPRRGEGMGRGPQGPDDGMLRPEEIPPFLEFTQKHFPEVHDQLVRAREEDPRAFRQMLHRLGPPMVHLMRMSQDDPEEAERIIRMQKLELRIRDQKRAYESADTESAREAARIRLRKLLDQKFDLRQERLRQEIEDLRKRLDEQTQRLKDQDQHKQQILETELQRILKGPRDHGRPGPTGASRPAGDS